MKYFLKFLCQFVSFFLVFTIGFLSCVAVIVGGAAYAYCNVSIDKLNEWGLGINTGGLFDPNAEVPVNSLTLQTLLEEILGISGKTDQYSLQDLIERYGLILPEEVIKYLPDEVIMDTAIDTLFSKDGLEIILKYTPLSYIFDIAGTGLIPEKVYETMGDVTLYDIIFPEGKDYSAFLKGVQLGFFFKSVVYVKDAEGNYVPKYIADPQDEYYPTLLELLAPIDLGVVLGVLGDTVFIISVLTMRDSWRAGVAENDKTELVTDGIYSYSRNPAFLGFDLVYIGILLMFFNTGLFEITLLVILLLHLQIVNVEEDFLIATFGQEYVDYRKKVRRYFGRRRG